MQHTIALMFLFLVVAVGVPIPLPGHRLGRRALLQCEHSEFCLGEKVLPMSARAIILFV